VKKSARKIIALYPDKFGVDYEANKKALEPLVDARTKRLRNRIVGYITRLKIVEVNRASATTEIPSESKSTAPRPRLKSPPNPLSSSVKRVFWPLGSGP